MSQWYLSFGGDTEGPMGLSAARGVSIGIHFQRKILTALSGGEGFVLGGLGDLLDGDNRF